MILIPPQNVFNTISHGHHGPQINLREEKQPKNKERNPYMGKIERSASNWKKAGVDKEWKIHKSYES